MSNLNSTCRQLVVTKLQSLRREIEHSGEVKITALEVPFALGAVLFNRGPSPQYQSAMEAQRLETAAKMANLKVTFCYGLAGFALLALALGLLTGLRMLHRRAHLIRPSDSGLFPIVEGQAGDQTYYHDPNRQLAGTVTYRLGADGVEAQPLLPAGAKEAQLQVTTQAQAAQVVAASGTGGMSRSARRLVEGMTKSRPVPRMPETVVVEGGHALPEERRLLAAVQQDWEDEA